MKTFDLVNTPLAGTNLIEANAGTGKTYTIAGLFLRLILEKHFPADQILVVTFTKAATAELKDRIYNKLLCAKEAFLKGSSDDRLIEALVRQHNNSVQTIRLIEDALIDFDKAAIFTIHGFCQRILYENAFETGSLFDTELTLDQTDLMQEVADDFWRKHFYNQPPEFLGYCIKKISGPEYFLKLLDKIKTPDIKIIPDIIKPSLENLDPFRETFDCLKKIWAFSGKKIESASEGLRNPSLNGTVYGSIKPGQTGFSKRDMKVFSMIEAMDRFVDSKSAKFPLFKDFEKFTSTKLIKSAKKNHIPPSHEFFDICDKLYKIGISLESEMERYLLFLKTESFKFAKSELFTKKKKNNTQFFDDLLMMVVKALEKKQGNELARAIRQKYQAALVDEFQDTDPVQYEIFSRLFSSKDSVLFMIGDPKQAIYSFRGADIFSYMKAARNARSKYTLTDNWRSEAGLITAINTIFSNVRQPFVFDEIGFEKGKPAKKIESVKNESTKESKNDEKSSAPLKLWFLGAKKDGPINKTEAIELIAEAVAGEISSILSHDNICESDYIKESDIAVLVRTNRQAQVIKKYLSAKNIPSVLYSAENIFDSPETAEMERILQSISEPANERLFKSALVTDIMGVSGEEIDLMDEKTFWRETGLANFMEYFQLWHRHGFIRMFRLFMTREKVRKRLLLFPDGERRLTNLLHLAEILHRQSIEKKPGIKYLLKWLSEQKNPASPRLEEHQLRLESDANAVKIVTIHKSKGLEYKIVFCPFGWEGSLIKKNEIVFHDNDENQKMTLDLNPGNNSGNVILAQNELLAENLRLLYVALTRAKKRCYLVWGQIRTAETSAMSYLFHCKDAAEKDNIAASLKETFSAKKDNEILDDLTNLVKNSKGSIELALLPLENHKKHKPGIKKEEELVCRKFSGKIDADWKISSFSSLVSKQASSRELSNPEAYRDTYRRSQNSLLDQPDQYGKTDIFSFPKGTRAGTFFHDIFEHLDFAPLDRNFPDHQKKLVENKLKAYGFDLKWQDTVCNMTNKVLSVPLLEDRSDLVLSSIKWKDRINEMEFYFPLKRVTPQKLKKIFADYGGIDIPSGFSDRLENLAFSPTEGFMKGYIDMIFHSSGSFYLVDWKSNFLGSSIKDYDKDSLDKTMKDDFYILQYHIYTLALHQYLRIHMPGYRYEKNFGGIFYIFIRGVEPDRGPEFGIYKDIPVPDLINELGRLLIPDFIFPPIFV